MIILIFHILILKSIISLQKIEVLSATDQQLNKFLESGSMEGFFTHDDFWNFYEDQKNDISISKYFGPKISLGKTKNNNDIWGFYVTDDVNRIKEYKSLKRVLLITALHHSREPISLSTIVLLMIEFVRHLSSPSEKHNVVKAFFRDHMVFFIPIINVDSYIYINLNQHSPKWEDIKMIRKNRNIHAECDEISGGVDLNRNYGFNFGIDNDGSSCHPCAEDYRGEKPFSESETQAVRDFVEKNDNIVSAINIHSFGNAWIYPFGFKLDKENIVLKDILLEHYNYYNEFTQNRKRENIDSNFGNTPLVLDYITNGESSDWMANIKGIFSFDLEVGNPDRRSEQFYPPKEMLSNIVRFNWIVFKKFMENHIVTFKHYILIKKNKMIIRIFNQSISFIPSSILLIYFKFQSNDEVIAFDKKYCIKEVENNECEYIPLIKNEVSSRLKGRFFLEIFLEFKNEEELEKLASIVIEVKRSFRFYDYKEQKFELKTKRTH